MGANPEPSRAGSSRGKWKGRREVRVSEGWAGCAKEKRFRSRQLPLMSILTLLLMEHCVRDSRRVPEGGGRWS